MRLIICSIICIHCIHHTPNTDILIYKPHLMKNVLPGRIYDSKEETTHPSHVSREDVLETQIILNYQGKIFCPSLIHLLLRY